MSKKSENNTATVQFCKNCSSRNNDHQDRREEEGGCGWCSVQRKYVPRRGESCEKFSKRKGKKVEEVNTPVYPVDQVEQEKMQKQEMMQENAICTMCGNLINGDKESGTGFCNKKNSYVSGVNRPLACEDYFGPKPAFVIAREKYEAKQKEIQEKIARKAAKKSSKEEKNEES